MERTLDIIPVSEWGFFDESIPPLVIAGPCSAESELQVMMTAFTNSASMFSAREYGSPAPIPDPSRVSALPD